MTGVLRLGFHGWAADQILSYFPFDTPRWNAYKPPSPRTLGVAKSALGQIRGYLLIMDVL